MACLRSAVAVGGTPTAAKPSNHPTFQPSNHPTFQPSNLPTI
ncbi:MAG: PT domain-containing protein [Saprospiraceae bacterium]|nr:PT domain-containing protein [Saprospiraceae bacterium]